VYTNSPRLSACAKRKARPARRLDAPSFYGLTCLDLDERGVVVRVPEATLEAKHDALHVQPYGLVQRQRDKQKRGDGRRDGEGVTKLLRDSCRPQPSLLLRSLLSRTAPSVPALTNPLRGHVVDPQRVSTLLLMRFCFPAPSLCRNRLRTRSA